jgi:hypothetical protein
MSQLCLCTNLKGIDVASALKHYKTSMMIKLLFFDSTRYALYLTRHIHCDVVKARPLLFVLLNILLVDKVGDGWYILLNNYDNMFVDLSTTAD